MVLAAGGSLSFGLPGLSTRWPGGDVFFPPSDAAVLVAGGLVFPGSVVIFATTLCPPDSAILSLEAKLTFGVVASLARNLDATLLTLGSLGLERDLVLIILTVSNAGFIDIPFCSFPLPLVCQILLFSTFWGCPSAH